MLEIDDLHASIGDKPILKGLTLSVRAGEIHAIMGPNGAGKSTLSHVIAGHPDYRVTAGGIRYQGQDLLALSADARARLGVFMAFQNPVAIPGVNSMYFLRTALNAIRKQRGEGDLDAAQFLKRVRGQLTQLGMGEDLLQRAVNVGFSGGEMKRHEILQMAILEPCLAVLDETDSGLDIDALKIVADGVNTLRSPERSVIMITHYQRLLDHIRPDFVHILVNGRLARSGDMALVAELERSGYSAFTEGARDTHAEGVKNAHAEGAGP